MKYIVPDTNVLILAFAGVQPWNDRMREWTEQGMLLFSPIVIAEFLCKAGSKEQEFLRKILNTSTVIPIDEQVARQAAEIRRTFLLRSYKAHMLDNFIAAQCVLHNATLATENVADYPVGTPIISKNSL